MKEYLEKHDFVEASQPGFQAERSTSLIFLLSSRIQCHTCGWHGWYRGHSAVHAETEKDDSML